MINPLHGIIAKYLPVLLIGLTLGLLAGRGCCPECPQTASVKFLPPSITKTADSSLKITPKQPVKVVASGQKKGLLRPNGGSTEPTQAAGLPPTILPDSAFVATLDTAVSGVTIHAEYAHPQNILTVDVQCPPDTSRTIERIITVTQPVEITRKEGATLGERTLWAAVGAAVLAILTLVFGE